MMNSWKTAPLIALADYINGYAFKPEDHSDEGLPIIRIEQLKDDSAELDHYDKSVPEYNLIRNGDLIFSWSASLFLRIWDRGDAILNQHLFKVIPYPDVDKQYLKYCIEYNLPKLSNSSHGSTMKHITRKELKRFHVSLPSEKKEQAKIAEVLATIDHAIAQTEALIAKHRRIKMGLMQDLLTRGIDEHGQLRDPSTHRFKSTPLGMIPEEWEYTKFSSIVTFPTGQVDPRKEPYRNWILVAPDHIESGTGRLLKKVTAFEQGAISGKYVFTSGAVLYTKIRPYLQKVTLADFDGLCSADMYPLRPAENVDITFLLMILLSKQFTNFAITVSDRSGFPKINRTEMSEYYLNFPPKEEQIRIGEVYSKFMNLQDEHIQGLAKLSKLKAGLMQDLLSGRVLVKGLME